MNELKIITNLYGKFSNELDDCFFFDGKYLVTTDTISEKTHFKHEWSTPQNIAIKLVEVNVSDIAASGGRPKYAFLNLGLSNFSRRNSWILSFLKQLKTTLKKYEIILAGGDTYQSINTNLTMTLIGEAKRPILRSNGNYEDFIYLTGSIGLSIMGLKVLNKKLSLPAKLKTISLNRHLQPVSRLNESLFLNSKYAISAMIDITDGLLQDSAKLAFSSNIQLEININKIPNIIEYKKYIKTDEILNSGEELELLFLSSEKIQSLEDCQISYIGKAKTGKPKVSFLMNGKKYIPKEKGFFHFA